MTQQAAQIGYLPRLRIDHTSEEQAGQIYVPWINWALCVAVLALVFTFRTSTALAYAYGVAVTGTITITTLLFFYIARQQWRWPLWRVIPIAALLLTVDGLFFAANLTKLPHGAWLPLAIGIVVFIVLTTWQKGRQMVTRQRARDEGSLREFIDELHARKPPLHRVPGTSIFLNRGKETAPLAMRANVEHNHVLHEHVVILAIQTLPVPHVAAADRLEIDDLGYRDDRILPRHRPLRLHGHAERPLAAAAHQQGRGGRSAVRRRHLLFPVHHRNPPREHPGHEPLAQAPVRRHRPADGRRGRVLPAPPRAHRHHGCSHRTLS